MLLASYFIRSGINMKIRTSFVANSSSSSFIILSKQNEPATLKINDYLTLNLDDIYNLSNNKDDDERDQSNSYNNLELNYVPDTLNKVFDCAFKYLHNNFLYKLHKNFNDILYSSAEEYAEESSRNTIKWINKSTTNEDLSQELVYKYYYNEYNYIVNAYNIIKRMFNEYYKDFIQKNISTIEGLAYSSDYFKEFFKKVNDYDNNECFSFEQYCRYFSIHNNGAYKANPIIFNNRFKCNEESFKLCDTKNKKELEYNSIRFYKELIDSYNRAIKILLAYIYCHYTNSVFQEMEIPYSGEANEIDNVVNDVYSHTKFLPPIANFDIISQEY